MTQGATRSSYKPRRADRKRSRVPLAIALAVVAVAVVVALFFAGFALAALFTPKGDDSAAAPTPTPTATPTPTPTGPPTGPVPPGTYAWDQLGGGECLDGYTSPWAEEFTVVPCDGAHDAQLVRRGELEGVIGSPYPGESSITEQMTLLCTDPTILDLAAAGQFSWMQWQAAFPPNADEWNKGDRSYYCFFNRSSGEKITGTIVVTG